MRLEYLGNYNNTLIAISIADDSSVSLAFTDETTLVSISINKATVTDFQYLTNRFSLNPTELIDWFKSNDIDILSVLPD